MKKVISALVVICMLSCILFSMDAEAGIVSTGGMYTYTSGGCTIYIKDLASGKTTTGKLILKRNNTLSYLDLARKVSTWYCSLDIIGENYHNLRLNQSTVTTEPSPFLDEKLFMNFSLSYTQHANYQYVQRYTGYTPWETIDFYKCQKPPSYVFTVPTEVVDSNTERTVTLGTTSVDMGLLSESASTDYNRYTDNSITLEYGRPSYKVSFTDEEGKVIEEQTVLRGDNAKKPTDPVKEGYYFGGWDKSFLNVKENLIISPKWISKDGSNPPITGDDALSVHTDLYDEAQTFYVPNIDTELINPQIE